MVSPLIKKSLNISHFFPRTFCNYSKCSYDLVIALVLNFSLCSILTCDLNYDWNSNIPDIVWLTWTSQCWLSFLKLEMLEMWQRPPNYQHWVLFPPFILQSCFSRNFPGSFTSKGSKVTSSYKWSVSARTVYQFQDELRSSKCAVSPFSSPVR